MAGIHRSEVAQSCPTLCNPMDCGLPGSSVHGILQARILEWVAIPFSKGSSWPRDWTQVSHIAGRFFTIWATTEAQIYLLLLLLLSRFSRVQLCATPSTVAHQAPPSLLVACKILLHLLRTVWQFLTKPNSLNYITQHMHSLIFIQTNWNLMSTQKPANIFRNLIDNYQNLEATKISFNR